jgi:indolepyruvate ferredoxin oxidoreductase, beta subunit
MNRPLTILVAALGGEGGGVLAEWLVDTATDAGFLAQSTSIPGVAQRTGATTYYIELFPVPLAELRGQIPVLSLLPVPGCIDLFVGSELLEAVRNVEAGMVSRERTTTITSSARTLTTAEKMVMGDGRYDGAKLGEVARANSRKLFAFDMGAAAAGTALSSIMLGAIAASGIQPRARPPN